MYGSFPELKNSISCYTQFQPVEDIRLSFCFTHIFQQKQEAEEKLK